MRSNKKSSFSFKGRVGADNKKERSGGGGGGTAKYLSLPKDLQLLMFDDTVKKVEIDILPYIVTDKNHPDKDAQYEIAIEGSPWYKRPIRVHKDVGAKRERHICLASLGKKCPICEIQKELFDQNKKEEAVALYPQDRVLYLVIPRNSKKHDEVPYIWDMSYKMFQEELKNSIEEDEDYEDFPSLENGKTLEIKFHWDTIGDKGKPFPEVRHIEFLDRDPLDESIMDDLPSLDDVLNILSYKELEAKFLGEDIEDAEEDDDKPKRRENKTAPALRKGKFEKEKDDEDDLTWVDVEEMSIKQLNKLVNDKELDVDTDEYDLTDADVEMAYRVDIAEALEIKVLGKKTMKKEPEKSVRKSKTITEEKEIRRDSSERSNRRPEATASKNKCPYGHIFGKDTDKFDECGKCKIWDDCDEAYTKKK